MRGRLLNEEWALKRGELISKEPRRKKE